MKNFFGMKVACRLPLMVCVLSTLSMVAAYAQTEDQFNSNSAPTLQGGATQGSIPIPQGCSGTGGCPGSYFSNGPTGTQSRIPGNTGGYIYGSPNTTRSTGTQAVPVPPLNGGVQRTAPLYGGVQQQTPFQGRVQQSPYQGRVQRAAPVTGSTPRWMGRSGAPSAAYGGPAPNWQGRAAGKNFVPPYGGGGYSPPNVGHGGGFQQALPGLLQAAPAIVGTVGGIVNRLFSQPYTPAAPQYPAYPYYYGAQRTYSPPPSPQYQYERTPSAHPRTYAQRGIARQPKVLDVPIPPQGSLFVPGLQNAADVVNFLSTYHPLETFYTGLAIAGGQLAGMGIVPGEVAVTDAVGGKLYKLNVKVLNPRNPLDASVNPELPKLQLLDRPVARNAPQNAIKDQDLEILNDMRVTEIRVDQQQLSIVKGELTRVGINRPDVQFTFKGRRYYIEYDTANSTRGVIHALRIMANDPKGIVILKTAP